MEATKLFKDIISDFLSKESENDPLFAKKMQEHREKTPEAVCNYIMSEVSRTKQCGWSDDEIFSMAKHFIDEDSIKDPGTENIIARVVTNRHTELSEDEIEQTKKQAKDEFLKEMRIKAEKDLAERNKIKNELAKKAREKAEKKREKEYFIQGDLFGELK